MKIKTRYKVLLGIIVILGIAVAAVTYYFEGIAKSVIVAEIEKRGLSATIEDLDLGLLRGTCALSGVDLKTGEGQPLLKLASLEVNTDFWKALSKEIVVEEVAVGGLEAEGSLDEQGQLNWVTLAKQMTAPETEKPSAGEASSSAASFELKSIRIQDLKISVTDTRKGSPIQQAHFSLGSVNANLKQGAVSVEKVHLDTGNADPRMDLESAKAGGSFDLASGASPALKTLEVRGLSSKNRMTEKGQLVLLEWIQGIAGANGLLKEESEKPSAPTPGQSSGIPEKIALADIDLELLYPGEQGNSWSEKIKIGKMEFDTAKNFLDLTGMSWANEAPVAEVAHLKVDGNLLGEPIKISGVLAENVDLRMNRKASGNFALAERMERLTSLLPKSEAKESGPAPVIGGPVKIGKLRFQIDVEQASGQATRNILALDSLTADLGTGQMAIQNAALSSADGSLDHPSLQVASIAGKGNLAYPLPAQYRFETLQIQSPRVRIVRDAEGKIDLLRRVEELTGTPAAETPAPRESTLDLLIQKLDVLDLDFEMIHQMAPDSAVTYRLTPAKIEMEDIRYSPGGKGVKKMAATGTFVAPSKGGFQLDAKVPEQKKIDNFESQFGIQLEDITGLKPYYAETLPFQLDSGGFKLDIAGACKDRQLDFPYAVSLLSPQMTSKPSGWGALGLEKLTGDQSVTLLNSLRDKEGNVNYKGKLTGTLDNPKFFSIWQGLGQGLAGQLTQNVTNLPGLATGIIKGTGQQIIDQTGNVGGLIQSLPGMLVPKKQEQK
jgi:hypothetical protein